MGVKKLTVKGQTVDEAIWLGLEQIGLEQERTVVEIIQHSSDSMFGHREAIVSILFDEEESNKALVEKTFDEFREKFEFRFADGQAQILVPACFYDDRYVTGEEERTKFLKEYLEQHQVPEPDEEKLKLIASDFQYQYKFEPVLELPCEDIGSEGGSIHLEVSDDKMLCRGILFHADDITEADVLNLLRSKGITHGLQLGNIKRVLASKYTGYFDLARGIPAQDDKPGSIDRFFQEDEHKEFAKMMEMLTIDTRSVKDINIADRNQILMRIGDIVPGKSGCTITGELLEKQDVTEGAHGIKTGPNVYFSDCGREIYAKKSGHIVWRAEDGYIDVEPVYIVDGNVDFSEGNIIGFVGKVIIKGDVRPRFSVVAEGDVEIHGSVEDATVRSTNGSVFVAGSIIHKMEGSISARKTVHCNICTNAKIRASKILIEKESMNSQLEAECDIIAEGTPGTIIGGQTIANKLIRANSIGSERGVPTKVHVGDVTELKNRLRKLQQRVMEGQRQLKETQQVLRIFEGKLNEHELSEQELIQYKKAQQELVEIEDSLEVSKTAEGKIKEDIEKRKGARLELLKELHREVDVHIFEGYMLPTTKEHFCGFICKDGRVSRYSI